MRETMIGGIVLCGGHSVRMGRPKEWLPVEDETLLQRTVRVVGEVCDVIVVAGRRGQALPPLPSSIEIVSDEFAEAGPVAGIEAGLRALRVRCKLAVVTACDHPRLNTDVLAKLLDAVADHRPVIVEHMRETCPLLGVYSTELAGAARAFLQRGGRSARDFAEECHAIVISSMTFREVDPKLESFINANDEPTYATACLAVKPMADNR